MPGCSSGCPAADEFKTSQKDNMKKSVVKIQFYLVSLETLLVFRWKSRHEVTAFFIGILEMVQYSSCHIKFSIFLLGRTNIANLSEARSPSPNKSWKQIHLLSFYDTKQWNRPMSFRAALSSKQSKIIIITATSSPVLRVLSFPYC